jgi:hypothetical protein
MTTSSAAKGNMTGGRKDPAKPSSISSSLKTIMKYGGNVASARKEGTKRLQHASENGNGGILDEGNKTSEIGSNGITGNEMGILVGNETTNGERLGLGGGKWNDEDVDMSLYDDDDDGTDDGSDRAKKAKMLENKEHSYETIDKALTTESIVQHWEKEVETWEREVARASTGDFKALAESKLTNAQLMLKEALLRMTIHDDCNMNISDNEVDDIDTAAKASKAE